MPTKWVILVTKGLGVYGVGITLCLVSVRLIVVGIGTF